MNETYIYFNDSIEEDLVNNLVDKIQSTEGKIRLYFSTDGGYTDLMSFLVDLLNSRKEDITLVLLDLVASAGTHLLTDFEGQTDISRLEVVLFHAEDRSTYQIRKQKICSKKLRKMDMENNRLTAQKFLNKGWLTEKQVKKFMRGEDVVLYKEDIQKIKL